MSNDQMEGHNPNYSSLADDYNTLRARNAKLEAEVVRLRKAALAYRELCACYRVGKRPSEKLFEEIMFAKEALEASDDK